jgi:hypothetical protein
MMAGVLFWVAAKMAAVPQIEIIATARSLRVIIIWCSLSLTASWGTVALVNLNLIGPGKSFLLRPTHPPAKQLLPFKFTGSVWAQNQTTTTGF